MIKHSEFAEGIWKGFGPSRILPDPASHQHDHANIRRRLFQSRTHVMSTDHSAASLILKTITIRLNIEAAQHDTEARYELALNALATALIVVNSSVSPAWTVQPVPGNEPLLYNLAPLQEHSVSIAAAWEMADALRLQPQVVTAEPTFVMLRNDH
jgi:hypothetical protein